MVSERPAFTLLVHRPSDQKEGMAEIFGVGEELECVKKRHPV